MKTCPYCGRENQDGAARCQECGTELTTTPTPIATESTNRCERIASLESEVEAERLDLELENRQIPHVLGSFSDSALDGLFQLGRGWGYVEAPPENREAVLAVLRDMRQSAAETEPEPPPEARPVEAPAGEPVDPLHSKLCVSCRALIPESARLCPKCGWTQPESQ